MQYEIYEKFAKCYFNELWTQGKVDIAKDILSDDFVSYQPLKEVWKGKNFLNNIEIYRSAFPDLAFKLDETIVAEGNKLVVRWTAWGTHQGKFYNFEPTGKKGTFTGISIFHMKDGKAAQEYVNCDVMGLLDQLGVVEVPQV